MYTMHSFTPVHHVSLVICSYVRAERSYFVDSLQQQLKDVKAAMWACRTDETWPWPSSNFLQRDAGPSFEHLREQIVILALACGH